MTTAVLYWRCHYSLIFLAGYILIFIPGYDTMLYSTALGVWGGLYSGSDFCSGRLYSGRPENQGNVEVRVVLRLGLC